MQTERKHFDKQSLLTSVKKVFSTIADPGVYQSKFPIADCLMSASAVFGLKYASLLQMDKDLESDAIIGHNLKKLYQITNIPSDSQLRVRLDGIDDAEIHKLQYAIDTLIVPLQRGKILNDKYTFLDEYHLVSIDGTGFFSSDSICCDKCCIKHSAPKCDIAIAWSETETRYVQQLLDWKINNAKKDSILILYSLNEDKWHMYTYDGKIANTKQNGTTDATTMCAIDNAVSEILSTIKDNKISKEIKDRITYLLLADGTLFDGRNNLGKITYYHQILSAVLVHPHQKQVFPLAIEPITKQDGATKNDCERNAAVRLLHTLKNAHPHLKMIIVVDALYANGPLIKLLQELDFRFIITAKNTEFLLNNYKNSKTKHTIAAKTANYETKYSFDNGLSLNAAHKDIKVNFFECNETKIPANETTNKKKKPKKQKPFYSSWITDLQITADNVHLLVKGARSRWKIENETFNTLKNQGYNFEHNYGHGDNNLSTVFCYTMFIAFLIDQIQQCVGYYIPKILSVLIWKKYLWDRQRIKFFSHTYDTWDELYKSILDGFAHMNTT